jgi:RNA polymerase-binding transcription factor
MDEAFVRRMEDRLQKERHALVEEMAQRQRRSETLPGDVQHELEEQAQIEVASGIVEAVKERQDDRLINIDDALARIEAGTFGRCQKCGREISRSRLEADPTTTFCEDDAASEEHDVAGRAAEEAAGEDRPETGRLPPDLDQLADDGEVAERLREMIAEDGQVDMQELEIKVEKGVVFLEGAVPSEPEHQVLLRVLTDVAGVQDIVDHLEVQRLAWEREDRWKEEDTQDVLPGTIPNQEPYGGTEDVVLSEEEGVDYEPPENPPPPPNRKD